jgi:hypothetical protein
MFPNLYKLNDNKGSAYDMYAKCEKVILGSTKKKQGTNVEFSELNKLFISFK